MFNLSYTIEKVKDSFKLTRQAGLSSDETSFKELNKGAHGFFNEPHAVFKSQILVNLLYYLTTLNLNQCLRDNQKLLLIDNVKVWGVILQNHKGTVLYNSFNTDPARKIVEDFLLSTCVRVQTKVETELPCNPEGEYVKFDSTHFIDESTSNAIPSDNQILSFPDNGTSPNGTTVYVPMDIVTLRKLKLIMEDKKGLESDC